MKALIISADAFEDMELLYPYYRLKEEGYQVQVASLSRGRIAGKHGYSIPVDLSLAEVEPEDYQLLVLPGGQAPEQLKKEPRAVAIARHFMERKKPVAAICHGPLILAAGGLLRGLEVTGYRSTRGELAAAGATFRDQEVVVHGHLVTSRQPSDLPAFAREMLKLAKKIDD